MRGRRQNSETGEDIYIYSFSNHSLFFWADTEAPRVLGSSGLGSGSRTISSPSCFISLLMTQCLRLQRCVLG